MRPMTPPLENWPKTDRELLLRFLDTPGLAPLSALPVLRCTTCDGIGKMAEATCPDCEGQGGTAPHSAQVCADVVGYVEKVIMINAHGDTLQMMRYAATHNGKVDSDAIAAYRREHLTCFLGGLMLATRQLIAEYVSDDTVPDALQHMHAELDGDWSRRASVSKT